MHNESKWYLNIVNVKDISSGGNMCNFRTGKPCRPVSAPTLLTRISIAWKVFVGKYDALSWDDSKDGRILSSKKVANCTLS